MQVKKVVADKFYKNKYVCIKGDVYDVDTALKLFKTQKEAILKATSQYYKLANVMHLNFKPLPSETKIIEMINAKRQEIYKSLGLKPTKSLNKQTKQAFKLLKHLTINTTYYMPIKEEVTVEHNKNYYSAMYKAIEKVNKAELLLYFTKAKLKANYISDNLETQNKIALFESILKRQVEKFINLIEGQKSNFQRALNKMLVSSIYKVLLQKKGVCLDYSYTYSYLLNGLGIENKIAHIKYGDLQNVNYHVLNMIEVIEDSKKQYAYVDVTENSSFYRDIKATNLEKNDKDILKYVLDFSNFTMTQKNFEANFPGVSITEFDYIEEFDESMHLKLERILDKERIEKIKEKILEEDAGYKEFYDSITEENNNIKVDCYEDNKS